jgi:hypothetical protein
MDDIEGDYAHQTGGVIPLHCDDEKSILPGELPLDHT